MTVWNPRDPSQVGLDPADYTTGQVPVKDPGGGFVPGAGGGGGIAWSDIDETLLFSDGTNHLGFPGFAVAPNGDFLIFYRHGASHVSGDGQIRMRRSTDRGQTWSSETTLLSGASWDYRAAVPTRLSDGRIVLSVSRNDSGGAALQNPDGALAMFSDDDGATWDTPVVLDTPHTWRAVGESQIVEDSNGTLLYPVWGNDTLSGDYYVVLMVSTDGGDTWTYRADIAKVGGSFNETGLIRMDKGRIVALIRDEAGSRAWFRAVSEDDGETWTTPTLLKSGVTGRPNPTRLPDGRIMAVWRDDSLSGRPGIVVLSDDEGATWDELQTLRATGNVYTYSQTAILGTDLWLANSYEQEDDRTDANIYIGRTSLGALVPLPPGGDEGQVLSKGSPKDWDARWATPADTFVGLGDTPSSFSGQAGQVAKVNESEDALEFGDALDVDRVRDAGRWEVVVDGSPPVAVTDEDETDWVYGWVSD